MLSYRHGFHAGNHADVLKHFVLVQLLGYLLQKDKALWYIDTHAGAAQYALTDSTALKNSEFETGIGRLWDKRGVPKALDVYVAQVRRANPDARKLRVYPGSPQIALQMLRPQDRLRLFEKHSTEIRILQQNLEGEARRAIVYAGDGFEGLKAMLPPPSRRGLVLIDPSYEDKADYKRTKQTLVDALVRFATGTYAIWYPLVQRRESRQLPNSLKLAGASEWLHVNLTVKAPAADGFGLHGSGMFIVNPPWTLMETLRQTMPWLVDVLAQDHEATFVLESG
ncbi:MAG TPA: 23S rRNA (adenine(2030)-N(6))-methyltransferase RlmJ [Lautropia sp.]|nr:23S rRNA (adenine(2030)-N(6))-methyltransferase RlmJ [Lautropia sp.]